ncbi:MAG: NAD-dependent epimerase/dehydratase family protein [Nitrososphaerales archaeon]
MQDSKILVTGGIGFIGSHLVQNLMDRGCSNITIYDNYDDFYPGKEENAKIVEDAAAKTGTKLNLIRGDILDYDHLSKAMKGSDLAFHLAAQAGIRYCNEMPLKANRVNVDGTLNVLTAAREHGIKKLVYASSSSIFGDPAYLPIDEKHQTNPNSPYGVSKLAAEQYCRVFAKVYGMNVSCLRYFSVYGPRGRPDQVIYAFAENIAKGKAPIIFGDGEQTRDFIFVSDVVDATILAMESGVKTGEVFNVGHGSRITINELVKKVITYMRSASGTVKPAVYQEKSRGDFPDTEANNEKARKLLGWNPRVMVDEGLKLFFDWFLRERIGPRS